MPSHNRGIRAIVVYERLFYRQGGERNRSVAITDERVSRFDSGQQPILTQRGDYDGGDMGHTFNTRCEGRYPVPGPRDEPFEVTYRCALPTGHDGPHGGDYPKPEEGTQELGSRFVSVGPVTIGCMAEDSRAALDLAMERWRARYCEADVSSQDDPVYTFAYWLFRWSGIVTGVNLDAPETPWTKV